MLEDDVSPMTFGTGVTYSTSYLVPVILDLLQNHSGKRVMDIGCGNGSVSEVLVQNGYELVGIEPSESGITCCREKMPQAEFYQKSLGEDFSFLNGKQFDVVLCSEVIEHLYDPAQLFEVAASFLSAGGLLLITCPYHGYLKNLILSLLNSWDFHWQPGVTGGHIKFWSRRTLADMAAGHGFTERAFKGAGRFPLMWKSMVMTFGRLT